MTDAPEIQGTCPDRFAAVKDAFAANFTDAPEGLNELGARFSVCIGGERVIDLWGGHANAARTAPFTQTTLTPVFSTGKAVMAILMATAVERGTLAYDERVAALWPAFGQAGKDQVTVGQLLSHQSGLPGFSETVDPALWFDPAAVLERLCAQAPMWPPGEGSGYHPITIGYLAGELFRLVERRSMGTALRQDFADLDLWIGLPQAEHGRVAQLRKPASAPDLGVIDAIKAAAFLDRGSAPGGRGSTEWRMMEIPSANLHGTALGLARMLSVVATGGMLDGRQVLSPGVVAEASKERVYGQDRVLPFVMSWGAGFTRNHGLNIFGPNPDAVGHCGWGGSCAFADPATGVSAAYVMTRQSPHLIGDPRAQRLIEALYARFKRADIQASPLSSRPQRSGEPGRFDAIKRPPGNRACDYPGDGWNAPDLLPDSRFAPSGRVSNAAAVPDNRWRDFRDDKAEGRFKRARRSLSAPDVRRGRGRLRRPRIPSLLAR